MKYRSMAIAATAFLGICAMISACSSAQSDWAKASSENTVPAYQSFLAAHPSDQHASDAQAMILQIQDNSGWQEAQQTGTSAGYQNYLQHFSQGSHLVAAKDAKNALDRADAWKTAQAAGTAVAVQSFLQTYPTGAEADQAHAKLKELVGYRVHLASETTQAGAQRKLAQLNSRLKEQAADFSITPDASGKSFSIDSSGMTEQDANSACESIKRKHEACQVVNQ